MSSWQASQSDWKCPIDSGLSNDDLMLCDLIFNIKLSKTNESLNLSHAVLLVAYKWKEFYRAFHLLIYH